LQAPTLTLIREACALNRHVPTRGKERVARRVVEDLFAACVLHLSCVRNIVASLAKRIDRVVLGAHNAAVVAVRLVVAAGTFAEV
jgi:hypothetical protein